MKSLLTKIISIITILTVCVGFTACATTADEKCAGGHTWELTSTTATCYDGGVESYKCKVCGETKTENVAAYGHDLVQSSYTAPTCKTNGEEVQKCSRCGFESKTTLLVVDHDYQVKSTTPSTCTTHGSQTLECSMCHETKTEQLPLADHDYQLVRTIASTCVTHGQNDYKCTNCTATKSEELPLAEHTYEVATKDATCFTHGGTVNYCSICGDEQPISETPLLEHDFGADGYCTHCGIYETLFDVDKLNVSWIKVTDFGTIKGDLIPNFRDSSSEIADSYWLDHTVTLTITMYDSEDELLESHSFTSATIPHEGANYGKLTIQYMNTTGGVYNGSANGFVIFPDEGNIFSPESRQNCTSIKIEISCEGYKTIEKTYTI